MSELKIKVEREKRNDDYIDEMNKKARTKSDKEEEMKRKYLKHLNRLNGIGGESEWVKSLIKVKSDNSYAGIKIRIGTLRRRLPDSQASAEKSDYMFVEIAEKYWISSSQDTKVWDSNKKEPTAIGSK